MHLKGALKILGLRKQEPLLPRLLFMGADPGDTLRTLAAVHTPEEWPLRWCLLAQQYEERGQEALAHKHLVSAAETLRLVAIYYRVAEYMVTNHDERASIWRKLVHCYQRAGRLFTPPSQILPVHSNGIQIPAWIRIPTSLQSVPCVITLGGVDGVKEEWYHVSQGYIERGWACVALDLPGQGELRRLHNHYWRPDPEDIISAAIDVLEMQSSIDRQRIVIVGGSAGGYFALRAAACDTRISACALISAPISLREVYCSAPPPIPQTIDYNLGSDGKMTSLRLLQSYTAEPLLPSVRCPVWLVYGGQDTTTAPSHAKRIKQGVSGTVEEVYFEDGDHICFNHLIEWQVQLHNWLEKHFNGKEERA